MKKHHCTACQGDAERLSAVAETLRLIGSLLLALDGGVKAFVKLYTNRETAADPRDKTGMQIHGQILQNIARIRALMRALSRRLDAFVVE